jgi:hypothetical protein
MFMQNFSSLASMQMDLIFYRFSKKYQGFLKKNTKFSNSEKSTNQSIPKDIFFEKNLHSSIFPKISKLILIFFTPEFSQEVSKFSMKIHSCLATFREKNAAILSMRCFSIT